MYVEIQNRKTHKKSTVTVEEWEKISTHPSLKHRFKKIGDVMHESITTSFFPKEIKSVPARTDSLPENGTSGDHVKGAAIESKLPPEPAAVAPEPQAKTKSRSNTSK